MEIEQVENGYIVTDDEGHRTVYSSLQEVFEVLLLDFEGRSESFCGLRYGKVVIESEK